MLAVEVLSRLSCADPKREKEQRAKRQCPAWQANIPIRFGVCQGRRRQYRWRASRQSLLLPSRRSPRHTLSDETREESKQCAIRDEEAAEGALTAAQQPCHPVIHPIPPSHFLATVIWMHALKRVCATSVPEVPAFGGGRWYSSLGKHRSGISPTGRTPAICTETSTGGEQLRAPVSKVAHGIRPRLAAACRRRFNLKVNLYKVRYKFSWSFTDTWLRWWVPMSENKVKSTEQPSLSR